MVLVNGIIGDFGKYHLWLCFIIFINKFGVAYNQMAIIFLAPPVKYHCPGNASCCTHPVYDKSMFTRTIVTEWNLICERTWLKDFNQTMFQFGVLIGSLIFGIVSDKHGRKPALIISVILEMFTGIVASYLPDFWSFTFVRMVLGSSVGGILVVSFVIVMEYVGNAYRDLISALIHVPFTMGYITLAAFGYFIRDYMYFQLAISLSNVFLLCYICILPETPRWLLVNRSFEAITLMEKVAKINGLPTDEIQQKIDLYLLEHKSTGETKKASVIDMFRKPNLRKNIMIMAFIWFVCSYCFYGVSQYICHLTGNVFVNVASTGTVCLCGCLIVIPFMKMMNRKTFVVIGNFSSSFCLLIIAFVPEGNVSVVLGCIGVLFSYMVFVIMYLYCSEMFPTVVRNSAIGITSMMARFGAMIAPFIANFRPLGQWCAPVAFGIFPLIAALLCLLLPETKDCELMMTLEEGEAFAKNQRGRNLNVRDEVA